MTTAFEIDRVLNLPQVSYQGYELSDLLKQPAGVQRLRPIQNEMLVAAQHVNGLLGPVGVGHGKTLASFLIFVVARAQKGLLLVPGRLLAQTLKTFVEASRQWRLVPITIWSYEYLQHPNNAEALWKLRPDVIVADEAHKLRYRTRARTRRILDYLQRSSPHVRFYAMSGTLAARSLKDYAHLAEATLGTSSPLPRHTTIMEHWAKVCDAHSKPDASDLQWSWPLVSGFWPEAPGAKPRDRVRAAYRRRLWTCPGVVVSREQSVGCGLEIYLLKDIPIPAEVRQALADCRVSGCRPDGEVWPDALSVWRGLRQLSMGFFYRWVWPGGVPDLDWLERRRDWHRQVRQELERRATQGYDSVARVAQAVAQGHAAGTALACAYQRWKEVEKRVEPSTEPVWISGYIVDLIEKLIKTSKTPVLVWIGSIAMQDACRARGLEVFGRGTPPPEPPLRSLVLSWRAHGEGRNLQAFGPTGAKPGWSHNFLAEFPDSNSAMEQLLGRTHRAGQQADEVLAYVLQHTEALQQALAYARAEAAFVEENHGQEQKLARATFVEEW